MKSSNGKFQSVRNNGLTIKHKPKKKKNTKVIDKELQIKNIVQKLPENSQLISKVIFYVM